MYKFILGVVVLLFSSLQVLSAVVTDSDSCFIIHVIDRDTRRGVPMVALTTTSKLKYYTDSNGIICFDEASLLNQRVSFEIFSHGYKIPGNEVTLETRPGTRAAVEIQRLNVAERLYRITGQDIYGESIRAGLSVPIRWQGLNGKVTGQDTFIETLYQGKIYWFWGDTFGPASFNGRVSGAVSDLPGKRGLNPEVGINLDYFVDANGLNKSMCDIPGPGLVWIDWLAQLPDEKVGERLFAKYTRVKTLDVAYERGIAVFDDSLSVFKSIKQIDEWLDKVHSSGHPVRINSNGRQYFYIFDRYGLERVPADAQKILDPGAYEHFTCLAPGSKFHAKANIDRDDAKSVVYSWKANTDAISTRQQYQLMDAGLLTKREGWFNPLDVSTGKRLDLNPASVFWNDYRRRWIMIAYEFCGQVWFLEADTPTGPWVYARKIVAHDHYDFYNVGQHPLFDQDSGRVIYLEGTYTMGFSGNPNPTPLYDYNQMMYRLALDDKRLSLPVPVYRTDGAAQGPAYLTGTTVSVMQRWEGVREMPFFALPPDRKLPGCVPVYAIRVDGQYRMTTNLPNKAETPLFYALPMVVDQEQELTGTWECEADGYPFSMDLQVRDNRVSAILDDRSTVFEEGTLVKDSIRLIIRDTMEKETYVFTLQVKNGQLAGRYETLGTQESGKLTGQKRDNLFTELFSSPATVPLYEYQAADETYSYSAEVSLPGMKRSEKPVCRVWRNPTSLLTLDHTARPVPALPDR